MNTKTMKIIADAFVTGDYYEDGPAYAVFNVNQKFIDRIEVLVSLCKDHRLSEVRYNDAPIWGPGDVEGEMNLRNGEIVVIPNGNFWFTDIPKYGHDVIESRILSILQVKDLFNAKPEMVSVFCQNEETLKIYEGEQPEE